jgi:hypothetical protein
MQKMIMESRYGNAALSELRHQRCNFGLCEHKIARDHGLAAGRNVGLSSPCPAAICWGERNRADGQLATSLRRQTGTRSWRSAFSLRCGAGFQGVNGAWRDKAPSRDLSRAGRARAGAADTTDLFQRTNHHLCITPRRWWRYTRGFRERNRHPRGLSRSLHHYWRPCDH